MSSGGPPKGILKNKQNNDSIRDSDRYREDLGYGGYGTNSNSTSGRGWESILSSATPQGRGSESSDMTNSLLNLESGSDRTFRLKLHEFVSRKGEMLFRPLGSDELPIRDRGTQINTIDHFGVAPSMDFFLRVDIAERRGHFFNTIQPGEIVLAELTSKTPSGLFFLLLCMEGSRSLFLEDLDITAYCPVSQMIPAIHPSNPNKIFAPGDLLRCEILSVKPESEKVVLGMKGNSLSVEMRHAAQLGLIFEDDFPICYKTAARERKSKESRTYEELLEESMGFHNPNSIACLATTMGILNNRNTMMTGLRGIFPANEYGNELRRQQNGKWAHGSVAEGIRHFKSGNLTEAFQCLNKALSIDAENVEGLVARGALFANKGGYEKAIEDFEAALKYNPNHFNAKKYLAETLVALGRQQDESGKSEEALASFGKCLLLNPDHTDSKDALWSMYSRIEKMDLSKLNPLSRARTMEQREKLKTLLHNEMKSPVVQRTLHQEIKNDEGKKKKKKESSSDSSSSDSSSDSDEKKGKKKKKKRKKKKTKNNNKDQQSLSPFSKRLADGGGNFAGVAPTKESDWPKPVIEEPKKKKKEKRKRKRRSSNTSSSSDSEDDKKEKEKKKKTPSDLEDLEAKLSAYFSKVEQEKIAETLVQPLPPHPHPIKQEVKLKLDPHTETFERKEKGPVVTRIKVIPDQVVKSRERNQDSRDRYERNSGETVKGGISGKIELRTDEFGNFHPHPDAIVRTVVNSGPVFEEAKPKFEMKIRSQTSRVPLAEGVVDEKSDVGSKWRKIGEPSFNASYTVTRLDGTAPKKDIPPTKEKPSVVFGSQASQQPKGTLYLPSPTRIPPRKEDHERNYRTRRNTSRSRSPSKGRWGRRKRSISRSSSSSNDSRRRSVSRSPQRRFRRGSYRGSVSRGERVERVRRVFLSEPDRRRGKYPSRIFRNVFPHASSRSRRSRSRSLLDRRRKSRSKSRSNRRNNKSRSPKSPQSGKEKTKERSKQKINDEVKDKATSKEKKDTTDIVKEKKLEDFEIGNAEISVGTLTTTDASQVEELLDQRKAQKKEEMKERNPDFFRKGSI